MNNLNDIVYPKRFILIENNKKIYKSLYNDEKFENIDEYLYSIVTSVTQEKRNDEVWHLIQYEDSELGWINLKDSIQIFRFQPTIYKVIESSFQPNELNEKMGIVKDFISHFKDNMLTIKSQISYQGEKYYSVFLKNKFHGFHKAEYFDKLVDLNIPIGEENIKDAVIYSNSKLNNPISNVPSFQDGLLKTAFYKQGIASVIIQANTYWISIDSLRNVELPRIEGKEKTKYQLQYDDLIYSTEEQKQKSIDMLKTIIGAKDYLNNTEVSKYLSLVGNKNSKDDVTEIKEELKSVKNENLDLRRKLRQSQNELKLSNSRLDHQIDYKGRLEEQRDKYKARMDLVEEKLTNLNLKYKELKKQKSKKRKFF